MAMLERLSMMSHRSLIGSLVSILTLSPAVALAQEDGLALEEVVVTAQRREQSLQEVPISIEAFGGAEIQQQGYRDMDDLANFSPTVLIDPSSVISQDISIRGFGTTGNALTLEQAVPTFVDGVHYGRTSQIKTAFLDVERVEVLKGPQPVYFGQNATAGAFNIESRKPTPTWEGYINGEYANLGESKVEAAAGGPINDQWGIRVAAKYDNLEGYATNLTTGDKVGGYEDMGGRVIVRWTPNDRFTATAKIEGSKLRKDSEVASVCITDGSLIFGRRGPTDVPSAEGDERSVWADPPQGSGWRVPHIQPDQAPDCFESDNGFSASGPFFEPPLGVREENSNTGMIDTRAAMAGFMQQEIGNPHGIQGFEDLDSHTAYIDLEYAFDNGITVTAQTAYSRYLREYMRDNSISPFLLNVQHRQEDFHQWSQELRVASPTGGMFEWMVGAFWEKTDNNIFSNSPRSNVRRGLRFNDDIWEDQEWKSVFATVTFNFLDDKASIDLGGRYSDLKKTAYAQGYGSTWVFDVRPCDPDQADYNPATCPLHPDAVMVDPATARIFVDTADTANLWTIPWRDSRDTPSSWAGGRAAAVGLTAKDYTVREGPYLDSRHPKEFDPQVTLRYRPTQDLSFFARWAQSFKAGGFDTGQTSLPDSIEAYTFGPEKSETFEVGSKGTLMDNRVRFDITFFRTTFKDLQLSSSTGNLDDPFANLNAGEQRVQGVEFGAQMAVTEQLRLGLNAAYMDGKMTDYKNAGCTTDEAARAAETGCVLDNPADFTDGGTIDRSGTRAPRTPKWKFVGSLDYWIPVWDNYEVSFNAKGYYSDGYITDVSGFSKIVKYNKHGDLNLTVGFGDQAGSWKMSGFARNIFEARPSYNSQYDAIPDGFESVYLSPSQFFTYGVKFEYNYR